MYIRLTHYIYIYIYILSTGHMAPYAGSRVCRAVGFIRADTAFIYIYIYIYIRASDVGRVRLRFRWVVYI